MTAGQAPRTDAGQGQRTGSTLVRPRWRDSLECLVLQVPDIILAAVILWIVHRWMGLSAPWAVALFSLWVLKDLALYAVLRRTFMPPATGPEALVGGRAVTRESLAPRGYVLVGSELWLAEPVHPHEVIAPETPVVVRASRGLTLLVDADGPARSREEELP